MEYILGGIEIENVIWDDILDEVDKNGDGKLNLEEFMDLLTLKAENMDM